MQKINLHFFAYRLKAAPVLRFSEKYKISSCFKNYI